jgi:PAS domain S-box-containing protein
VFQLPDFTDLKLAALNATANSVVITDAVGTILWVNPAFTTLTGYEAKEVIGKNPRLLKSGQVNLQTYQQLWSTILSGQVWSGQLINKRKDGSVYVEEETITPIKTEKLVTHFIAIKQDVTGRVNTEVHVKNLNHFLDLIIENLPIMVFVKDAKDLKFIRFNKAGENLIGYTQNDLIGKNDYDLFPQDQADNFTKFDREVLNSLTAKDIPEESINTKNNGLRILHTKKVPLLDDSGKPIYLLGISEDITETREAANKLQEKINELQKANELMVNRELRMIELKEQLQKYEPHS